LGIKLKAALVLGALAAALAAAPAGSALPKLQGTVGPDFSIHLKQAGRPVNMLRAGSYLLTVADRSPIHDFHLRGPGVNRVVTSVAFVGRKTIRLKLRPGRYSYVCDPHHTIMQGSFTVH
jgi:hypothetical protein